MTINIQSVHFKASDSLQDHINDKLRKLTDLNGKIIRADVTLFEEGNSHNNQFCEIKLSVPGDNLFAKKNAETYEQAVSDVVSTLQKVLRRRKKD